MKRKYVILLSILVLIIMIAIAISVTMSGINKNLESLTSLTVPDVDLTKLEDGVYTGSYKVFPVAVEVKVTVENHRIAAIELTKHQNGQGKPAEVIPDRVIDTQSLQVDAVSGATYSSKVILKAIENALNSANK